MILHRRINEAVHIGEILVEVLAATQRAVQLRISAPPGTPIIRREQVANVGRPLRLNSSLSLPFGGQVS